MLKWAIIICGILTAALGLAVDRLIDTKADLKVAKLRAEQLDGQLQALHERYERAAAVRKDYDEFKINLRHEVNKTDWGRGRVPANIIRMLCDRADCAERYEVPAPDS